MKYVSYVRVSTDKQGVSGLGLEAQRADVSRFLAARNAELVAEFEEVESAKGSSERLQLWRAIEACRLHRATLLIAKLDRLSRNVAFLHRLKDSGVTFTCIDMPDATPLQINIMISIAEDERDRISQRTRAALAAKKARGHKLGGYRENAHRLSDDNRRDAAASRRATARKNAEIYANVIREIQDDGHTTKLAIARELTRRGVMTPAGKSQWHASQVSRVMQLNDGAELL